ncbi:MAG TPA: D-alanyl-D-alanine carboxypeptidase, partial [Sporichthya sp.]|nr:D-alanyl-D-alanine carboxypeptidase [Sporichthya sp.]
MRAVRRVRIGLGAAVVGLVLPALLASSAVAVDPVPPPSPGIIGDPAATPTVPTPIPPPQSTIGGPRMAERGLITAPGAPPVPATTAASWVIADAATGQVLAAKNPHGKYRPASTLKTLLALTMAPRLDPNSTIVADKSDENQEGTRVGMIAPQAYTVDDLWYGLLLRSGNDAANALARAGGGTVERGIRMMQAEAQRLQSLDTTVVNPSGLDADGQFSSAYDLALWGRAALERRDLRTYVSSLRHTFPGNHTATATKQNSKDFWVYTENRLILRGFEGAIGVKTGYTTLAQNTLIAAAERNGRTI